VSLVNPLAASTTPEYKETVVGVADLQVVSGASALLTTYALGSCLGITLYDSHRKIGGMLHVMLPDSKPHSGQDRIAMFLDLGLPELLARTKQAGGREGGMECKVFGGAQVMSADKFFRIGDRNAEACREWAAKLNLRVTVWEIGGHVNRTIKFYLDTGKVSVRTPSQPLFWR